MSLNKIALIVAYFLPKQVRQVAAFDWMDDLKPGFVTVECPEYTLRIEKVLNARNSSTS